SIDNGPYEMGTTRDTLGTTNDGGVTLGIDRPRTYNDLDEHEKKRFDADIRATNILYDEFECFKMIPGENITDYYVRFHKLANDMRNIKMTMPNIQLNSKFVNNMTPEWDRVMIQNVQGRQNQNQRNFARGIGAAGSGNAQNRAGNANHGQGKLIKCYNCGGFRHIARNCTQPKRSHNSDYFKEKMLLIQAQENGAVLDEEELLFLAGKQANTYDADVDDQPVHDMAQNDPNIFQVDDCDAFDSDVDDEPTAQTIFMANFSSAVSSLQQVGPSNASILSEVLNLENSINHHEIPNKVKQTNVLDSDSADMGNSNVIPYEQYVKHNEESVGPSSASSVQYDDYMLHENSAYVPDDSFTTTLNIYKDQSLDLEKRKVEELEANTPSLRKLAAATVYPPNTPAHLVPRTLPTKCKTVISIFVLNQLFADFDKTCTKRITQTGITERERGFEQTKRCYLTKVIPFFKLLKEHFEKTLIIEVKEMKEIFKSMEAEVDQKAIDLRSGDIERKNLLITNEILIAKCIAQDVFYTVTNSALTASQFHELYIAYNVAQSRAVELEAENLNLHKKFKMMIMITWTSKDAPEFDAFSELNEKDAQLQTHRNTIRKLKAQISQLKANKSDVTGTFFPQPLES
nr:hypothetical protein [Tanacetum cinerariifolium]